MFCLSRSEAPWGVTSCITHIVFGPRRVHRLMVWRYCPVGASPLTIYQSAGENFTGGYPGVWSSFNFLSGGGQPPGGARFYSAQSDMDVFLSKPEKKDIFSGYFAQLRQNVSHFASMKPHYSLDAVFAPKSILCFCCCFVLPRYYRTK